MIGHNLFTAEGGNGLNRHGHALFQNRPLPFAAVIGNVGVFVQMVADTVAHQVAHNAQIITAQHGFDSRRNITDMPAVSDGVYAGQ